MLGSVEFSGEKQMFQRWIKKMAMGRAGAVWLSGFMDDLRGCSGFGL